MGEMTVSHGNQGIALLADELVRLQWQIDLGVAFYNLKNV